MNIVSEIFFFFFFNIFPTKSLISIFSPFMSLTFRIDRDPCRHNTAALTNAKEIFVRNQFVTILWQISPFLAIMCDSSENTSIRFPTTAPIGRKHKWRKTTVLDINHSFVVGFLLLSFVRQVCFIIARWCCIWSATIIRNNIISSRRNDCERDGSCELGVRTFLEVLIVICK